MKILVSSFPMLHSSSIWKMKDRYSQFCFLTPAFSFIHLDYNRVRVIYLDMIRVNHMFWKRIKWAVVMSALKNTSSGVVSDKNRIKDLLVSTWYFGLKTLSKYFLHCSFSHKLQYLDLSCNCARLGGCWTPSLDPGLAPEKNSVDGGELVLPYELPPEDPSELSEFVLFLLESNTLIAP